MAEPITLIASAVSAVFGGGLVAGLHRAKVTEIEKDVENLSASIEKNNLTATHVAERLASLETKCDLILTHLRPPVMGVHRNESRNR